MATIYKYRIKCTTDNKYEYIWAESTPTTCPINTAHTINSDLTTIIDKNESDLVRIREEDILSGGNYRCESKSLTTNSMTTGVLEFSWKIPVSIIEFSLQTLSENTGDTLTVDIAPDTTIGTITSNVSSGATVIPVSQTVIDNVMIGYKIKLTDGVNTNSLGIILSKSTNSITVETATVNGFSAGTPTNVQVTVTVVESFEFGNPGFYQWGSSRITSSHIPANKVIKAKYTNNGVTSKKIVAKIELLY